MNYMSTKQHFTENNSNIMTEQRKWAKTIWKENTKSDLQSRELLCVKTALTGSQHLFLFPSLTNAQDRTNRNSQRYRKCLLNASLSRYQKEPLWIQITSLPNVVTETLNFTLHWSSTRACARRGQDRVRSKVAAGWTFRCGHWEPDLVLWKSSECC